MQNDIVFLCGHRKSGTSLFLNLLDGHPALSVYPTDVSYLYGYFPKFVEGDFDAATRMTRFDRVVFDELNVWLAAESVTDLLDTSALRKEFLARIEDRWADVGAITDTLAVSYNAVRGVTNLPFVMKESSIEIYAAELMSHFPNAKFIQVIRDPRDNFAALSAGVSAYYSRLGEDESATLASLLHRARLGFQYAKANAALFGKDRYLVVRFEDLVQNPRDELARVCAFLNVPWSDTLLTPTKIGRSTKGNSFDGFDFSAISARNVGRWAERISNETAAVIEFHFAELMEEFGYPRSASLAAQAAAAAQFYKWQNYRYFFSDRFASGIRR